MNVLRYISCVALLAGLSIAPAATKADDEAASPLPRPGSKARQLLLKQRLERIAAGTLASSLDHNRRAWESFSPEQRQRYRNEALAFLKANPQQQEELLARYEKFISLSAERRERYRRTARWINAVVETLSDAQRAELLKMGPEQRAEFLRQRRDELVASGELTLEEPDTQPAD